MKEQNICLCRWIRMVTVLSVVVVATAGTAYGVAREKKDKRDLITPEAKTAGEAARAAGVVCSGDATQLLFPLDATYEPADFCATPTSGFDPAECTGDPPDQHNDDDSATVPLNFTFDLYGDPYTTAFINNNGNLTFGNWFDAFIPVAFPDAAIPAMVAPFWSDVDTGLASTVQNGDVWMKQFDSNGDGSDDTLVVTWENVGYFDDHGDLLNTYQVAISDGANPTMGVGNNICFSSDNMCWTTGDASEGVGGFGGIPATVGANRGDGVDFFQLGRFDHEGTDFDGPFGANDGVSYLDNRVTCFKTCTTNSQCDDANDCTDDVCTTDACEHTPVTAGTACGDPTDDDCKNPDTCLAAVCQDNDEADGTACSDDGNEGTDDVCQGGVCTHKPILAACCSELSGVCTDLVALEDCQGAHESWTAHASCAEVSCSVIVPPGTDCYHVECGGTAFSFGNDPIPADFFAPGSDPFDGVVFLSGSGEGEPDRDLSIERLGAMVFGDTLPSEQTVDIELVSLNLVSCEPIEVQTPGGATRWNVRVGLSSVSPPAGTLTATKTHANGGVFTQTYNLQARYTFISVDDSSDLRFLDTAAEGIPPTKLEAVGDVPWVHTVNETAGPVEPCGENFVPGVSEIAEGAPTGLQQPNVLDLHCCGTNCLVNKLGMVICLKGLADCSECPSGPCCIDSSPEPMCEVVWPTTNMPAELICENSGGEFKAKYGPDCTDTDSDGIPDVRETGGGCANWDLCNTGTNPNDPDTDDDGCLDGEELAAGTNACDPCVLPDGGCAGTPAVDCDSDGVPDACVLQDPNADCGAPSDVAPNFVPDGIPDTCQATGFFGACCSGNACFNGTTAECDAFSGGVFQGFCTRCPTNLPGNTHQGREIVHFSTRPAVCNNTGSIASAEDCSQRTMFFDSWRTDLGEDGVMCHKFGLDGEGLGTPAIPADFFGSGSEPFDGEICLEGVPLGFVSISVPDGPLIEGEFGDADTIILRHGDPFDRCAPTSSTGVPVDIQVIALSLQSTASFTVDFGTAASQQWNAEVSISDTPIADLPLGELTAIKTHCNGGTYNSILNVLPRFTFTKADDPNVTVDLDFGTETDFDSVELIQDTNPQWVHDVEGDIPLADDPCTEFRPGVEALNIQTVCDCNGNGQRDSCDIEFGEIGDCNGNGVPDDCDVDPTDPDGDGLVSPDCNADSVPDECENDCNGNGIADVCDIRDCPPEDASCQDINSNGIPDSCEPDCNGNDLPDGWDLSTATALDCQPNGRPDECDLASGISLDCDQSSIPDECESDGDADGVIDPCDNCPNHANPDQLSPVGPPLLDPLVLDGGFGTKNRYISFVAGNPGWRTALRVTLTGLPTPYDTYDGLTMWVGPPVEVSENAGKTDPADAPGFPTFWAAPLQCDSYYTDWSAFPVVYVYDEAIVPNGVYDLQAIAESCQETSESIYSAPLTIVQSQWGDVISDCATDPCGPPDGVINVTTDVTAILNKFKNLAGAPIKARSDLDMSLPDQKINISDVTLCLSAFGGFPYPFTPGAAPPPCQ